MAVGRKARWHGPWSTGVVVSRRAAGGEIAGWREMRENQLAS
jgi:hypothetical protein